MEELIINARAQYDKYSKVVIVYYKDCTYYNIDIVEKDDLKDAINFIKTIYNNGEGDDLYVPPAEFFDTIN